MYSDADHHLTHTTLSFIILTYIALPFITLSHYAMV